MSLHFLADDEDLQRIGISALDSIGRIYSTLFADQDIEVELHCMDSKEIQVLNKTYRDLDEPTDVLSFPLYHSSAEIKEHPLGSPALIGSIVLCEAKAQIYNETLPQLVHHGLLHLIGYDHEQDMSAWQTMEEPLLTQLASDNLIIPPVPFEDEALT